MNAVEHSDRTPPVPLDVALGGPGVTLIEASAGSGKTRALTTLVARLVVEEGLTLDEILVVTFTRAATAELRGRIRSTLEAVRRALEIGGGKVEIEAGHEKRPEADPQAGELLDRWRGLAEVDLAQAARRLDAAVRDIDRANVHTIHGFCQRVLTDFAFECGFPFGFDVSEDCGGIVGAAVRDFWRRQLYSVSVTLAGHVVDGGFLPNRLVDWVSKWRAKTDLEVAGAGSLAESTPAVQEAETAWRDRFDETCAAWTRHGEAFRSEMLDGPWLNRNRYRRSTVRERLDDFEAVFKAGEPRLMQEGAAAWLGAEKVSAACKKRCTLPDSPLFEAFDGLEEASRRLRTTCEAWLRAARGALLQEVRDAVGGRIRDERQLGYDDLLVELEKSLEEPGGRRLAARLRDRYPAALIDEYQDTDQVQARIFARLYLDAEHGDRPETAGSGETRPASGDRPRLRDAGALFIVGDPKQSIYRFRGADVFAYLAARQEAGERLRLDRNWRSTPALVEAVNAVFAPPLPFALPEIEYPPAVAGRGGESPLRVAADHDEPLRFMLLPREGDRLDKGLAAAHSARAAAHEIARLLALAAQGEATLEGKPLAGSDIAVLVRTRVQGRQVVEALRERGVQCVEIDDASVFETREAEQVERLLWAIVEPAREARVRGALAGDLFGLDAGALLKLVDDEEVWGEWTDRLRGWREAWETRGIGAVLWRLVGAEGGAECLLRHRDGPRRLTNLRHLAELLQEAETRHRFTPPGLATWLSRRRADARRGEETQLRLESDEQLVKVLTVHGSKGLEFPVVFCPFAWDASTARSRSRDAEVAYHVCDTEEDRARGGRTRGDRRRGYREVLDLAPDAEARTNARAEELSESVRLLYVALTRAQHRCVVTWGQVAGAEYAPLAWLVHRGCETQAAVEAGSGELAGTVEGGAQAGAGVGDSVGTGTESSAGDRAGHILASAGCDETRDAEPVALTIGADGDGQDISMRAGRPRTRRPAIPAPIRDAIEAVASRLRKLDAATWRGELEALRERCPHGVRLDEIDTGPADPGLTLPLPPHPQPAARELGRSLRRVRQMTSYSALRRERGAAVSATDHAEVERPDHDDHDHDGRDHRDHREEATSESSGPVGPGARPILTNGESADARPDGLCPRAEAEAHPDHGGRGEDAGTSDADGSGEGWEAPAADEGVRTAFTFPGGRMAGRCLHRIFERLDESAAPRPASELPPELAPGSASEPAPAPASVVAPEAVSNPPLEPAPTPDIGELCARSLREFGFDPDWREVARAMVEHTRGVRLEEPGRSGFRLGDPVRRLVELEFWLPVAGLDRDRLATRIVEHGYPHPFGEEPVSGGDTVNTGGVDPGAAGEASGGTEGITGGEGKAGDCAGRSPIDGFLRGFIDLVVEHEGRWYVLDYKSNRLGPDPADYDSKALVETMRTHGYTLQYLIYLVALHRYLRARLPGYDYERHVGGVFYLFLRGLDPATGMRRGVYFDRPSAACLYALDDCFRGGGGT